MMIQLLGFPPRSFSMALALGLALGCPALVPAQTPDARPLDLPAVAPEPECADALPIDPTARLTDDLTLFPDDLAQEFDKGGDADKTSETGRISVDVFDLSKSIQEPSERALALQSVAEAAIFTGQYRLSHRALTEAANAAVGLPDSLVRDQRLIAIINTMLNLADSNVREAKSDTPAPDEPARPAARDERELLVRRAAEEWRRAAFLAIRIGSITYRSELLYRVVDNQSYGSELIVLEVMAPDNEKDKDKGKDQGDSAATANLRTLADAILVQAAREALRIARPVWRDWALMVIATNAAGSKQYARALQIARLVPQAEVRANALLNVAERQARGDDAKGATATYEEAARAVASIPLPDPRAVLTGVLIDNLITVGRFEDARKCVVLYPDEPRRLLALGAVAESQARRGRPREARAWIDRETPVTARGVLYRRVKDGFISSIEQNRSRSTSGR